MPQLTQVESSWQNHHAGHLASSSAQRFWWLTGQVSFAEGQRNLVRCRRELGSKREGGCEPLRQRLSVSSIHHGSRPVTRCLIIALSISRRMYTGARPQGDVRL